VRTFELEITDFHTYGRDLSFEDLVSKGVPKRGLMTYIEYKLKNAVHRRHVDIVAVKDEALHVRASSTRENIGTIVRRGGQLFFVTTSAL
jgi:hypothetical protein